MRCYYISFFVMLLLLSAACNNKEVEKEVIIEKEIDPTELPGLLHIVHFWARPDLTETESTELLEGVRSLEAIETVKLFHLGPPAATADRQVVDNSFSYALVLGFDDVEGHNTYQDHPIHKAFVAAHSEKLAKVRVRDNVVLE